MAQASQSVQGLCGGCGTRNGPNDKFCSSCGQTLCEKCPKCKNQAYIGQKFCNHCGHDLQLAFNERLQSRQERLDRASALAEKGKFPEAISVARPVTEVDDYRFREVGENAQSLIGLWQRQIEEWQDKLVRLPSQVDVLQQRKDYRGLVELLEPVPPALLKEEQRAAFEAAKSALEKSEEARGVLKQALADKDWQQAITELSTLLGLFPNHKNYSELMQQVAGKIDKQVAELLKRGKHAQALIVLDHIPVQHQSEKHQARRTLLEELINVRKIVAAAPSCEPLVGFAISKLEKLTPNDTTAKSLEERYQATRRLAPEEPFLLYPKWRPTKGGMFEESILPATLPRDVAGARPDCLAKGGARFWSALGLALYAIDNGETTADFLAPNRAGLWGRLTKKRAAVEQAWGVDLGRSAIKAVKLGKADGEVRIEDALLFPIDPSDQDAGNRSSVAAIYRHFDKVMSDPVFGDTPVVCSMPSCDLLARYVDLPTQNPSQHATFIDQEAKANIPIPFDSLATSYTTCPAASPTSVSQLAMLFALRKSDVEARAAVFNKANINLVSVVPEAIAMRYLAKSLDFLGVVGESTNTALLLIDVGTSGTSIHVVSRSGSWFRNIDWGVANITSALAAKYKITHSDADKLRRNLAAAKSLSESVACVADASLFPKRELNRSLRAAQEQLGKFEVGAALLVGGGAYQPLLGSLLNDESF